MKWELRDEEARSKWVAAGVIFVILLVAIGFGSLIFEDVMESRACDAFLKALNDLSPNATVTINGNTRQKEPNSRCAHQGAPGIPSVLHYCWRKRAEII